MLSGAEALNDALRQSHSAWALVTVRSAAGDSWTATVKDGTYTQDRTSNVRQDVDLTIASEDIIGGATAIRPFGDRLTIRRGIVTPDGKGFAVQLGVFRVDEVSWSKPNAEVAVRASGLMAQVVDEKFTAPRTIRRLADKRGTIIALVDEVIRPLLGMGADVPALFTPSETNAAGSIYERERIDAVMDLGTALGSEVYFSNLGTLVIEPVPDGTAAPVWEVDAGDEGVMVEYGSGYSRDDSYNAVVAEGRSAYGRPIRFVAKNEDPADPMRWGGPFGKVPYFYSSDLLTTPSACEAAARARLADGRARAKSIQITCVPHPGLEAGDVISVRMSATKTLRVLLDKVTLPLASGEMNLEGRIVSGTL